MTGSLPRTIVASAVVSVVLVGVLVVVGALLARPAIQRAVLSTMSQAADIEACERAPETFGRGVEGLSMYAYDRGGRSANPDAPAISETLLREALVTGETATHEIGGEVVSALPQSADGPCAVLRVSFGRVASVARVRLYGVLLVSTIGGMMLAAVGTFCFVVVPLRRRIDVLAASARGLGTETFEPQPLRSDPLGTIADMLAQSHVRVVEGQRELEQRNRALEDHLAGIAHDLRTPLASLQLALEALAKDSNPSRNQALTDVVYLSSLVENLHQGARLRHAIEVGDGRVDLGDVVGRLERRFAVVGRHAGVRVAASVPDDPVWVDCKPAFAERALANLVQNAIEHHDRAGHVAVTLRLDVDAGFSLTVDDDGPGMPEPALARLSEPTFLTEAARQRGPGLGLLISAEIARRAGWSISHAPLQPRGLRVTVRGPIRAGGITPRRV